MHRSSQFFGLFSLPSALALALSLGACGSGEVSSSAVSEGPAAKALTGTWAKQFVLTSESSAAGIRSKNKVVRLSLLNIREQDGKLLAEEKACDVRTLNSGATSINFPAALLRAFDTRSLSYNYNAANETFELAQGIEVLGARLSDPLRDALPQNANDARVIDQDRDGQAGVTVKVEARVVVPIQAELYVSQRTIWSEKASLVNENLIRGRVEWRQEQFTLGSSNPLFTTVKPSVTTLPNESTVLLQRVEAGLDCQALKARAGTLLPAVPAP